MQILVDRPRNEAALAIGATWILFCLAFVVSLYDNHDRAAVEPLSVTDVLTGCLIGAALVVVGFAATSRCRARPVHEFARSATLTVVSLGIGFAAGAVSLSVLLALARTYPGIRAQLTWPLSDPLWQPLVRAFGAAVVEEVACRLFLMGAIAWVATRFLKRSDKAYQIALYASALIFGLVHGPDFSGAGLAIVLLNGLAGVLLGWMFWRWGLMYAMLCHFSAGVIIQGLGPRLVA